jgi:hypothetical protein
VKYDITKCGVMSLSELGMLLLSGRDEYSFLVRFGRLWCRGGFVLAGGGEGVSVAECEALGGVWERVLFHERSCLRHQQHG